MLISRLHIELDQLKDEATPYFMLVATSDSSTFPCFRFAKYIKGPISETKMLSWLQGCAVTGMGTNSMEKGSNTGVESSSTSSTWADNLCLKDNKNCRPMTATKLDPCLPAIWDLEFARRIMSPTATIDPPKEHSHSSTQVPNMWNNELFEVDIKDITTTSIKGLKMRISQEGERGQHNSGYNSYRQGSQRISGTGQRKSSALKNKRYQGRRSKRPAQIPILQHYENVKEANLPKRYKKRLSKASESNQKRQQMKAAVAKEHKSEEEWNNFVVEMTQTLLHLKGVH